LEGSEIYFEKAYQWGLMGSCIGPKERGLISRGFGK
jgi:hypothetical protein